MKKNHCFATLRPQSNVPKLKACWLFGMLCTLLFTVPAAAQQKTISGKITDENHQPLEGVSVNLKTTKSGTVSNADGTWSLHVPETAAVLIFSMIGYVEQEVVIGSSTTINVSLKKDVAGLNEVVVVGYGTQKKVNLTGSVSTISSAQKLQQELLDKGAYLRIAKEALTS